MDNQPYLWVMLMFLFREHGRRDWIYSYPSVIHGAALPSCLQLHGISLLPDRHLQNTAHCLLHSSPLRQYFLIFFNVNMLSQIGALEIIIFCFECALIQKISKGKHIRKMQLCVSSSDSQSFS